MNHINVSIVLYKTEKNIVLKVLESCLSSLLVSKIYLIDNSPNDKFRSLSEMDDRIVYIFNGKNLGHGKAHNTALRESLREGVKYHLVLNPDVYFEPEVLEKLYTFMGENKEVGLVMPKVCHPDGSVQYLCKLLPTPFDLLGRRFLNRGSLKWWVETKNNTYELRFTGYDKIMDVPFLSGCFMFIRTEILKKAGLFDERYFVYCDDLDLSRRIHKISRTLYYPYCQVFHEWGKGSYKNYKLLWYHIKDSIKYFNKWGWFRDPERSRINKEILCKLQTKNLRP